MPSSPAARRPRRAIPDTGSTTARSAKITPSLRSRRYVANGSAWKNVRGDMLRGEYVFAIAKYSAWRMIASGKGGWPSRPCSVVLDVPTARRAAVGHQAVGDDATFSQVCLAAARRSAGLRDECDVAGVSRSSSSVPDEGAMTELAIVQRQPGHNISIVALRGKRPQRFSQRCRRAWLSEFPGRVGDRPPIRQRCRSEHGRPRGPLRLDVLRSPEARDPVAVAPAALRIGSAK